MRERHTANEAKAMPGLKQHLQGGHGPARGKQEVGAPVRAVALPSLPPTAHMQSGKLQYTATGRQLPTTVPAFSPSSHG